MIRVSTTAQVIVFSLALTMSASNCSERKPTRQIYGAVTEQQDGQKGIEETSMKLESIRRAGRYLIGKITDEAGQPINQVLVKVIFADGEPPYVTSTEAGEFHIMAPKGKPATLRCTATGYRTLEIPVEM